MVNQEVIVIVDQSGSMYGKEADTIGGINTMINTLKDSINVPVSKKVNDKRKRKRKESEKESEKESGRESEKESEKESGRESEKESGRENETIKLSIKFFDHEEFIKLNRLDINEVQNLEVSELVPRGSTALYDAVGKTIKHFRDNKVKYGYDICNIYVSTDGFENASVKYNADSLRELIESVCEQNIQMFYLGANQDAILEASKIGIPTSQAINFAENNLSIQSVYRSVAQSVKKTRTGDYSGFSDLERSKSSKE